MYIYHISTVGKYRKLKYDRCAFAGGSKVLKIKINVNKNLHSSKIMWYNVGV